MIAQIEDGGAVDVLVVMDDAIPVYGSRFTHADFDATRAAVAELVEADREYDAAYAAVGELRDGVSTIGEVVHAENVLHRAQSRRATALANVGGAK